MFNILYDLTWINRDSDIIINLHQLSTPNGINSITKEAVTNFFEGLATNITTTVAIGITLDPTPHSKTTKIKRDN